MKINNSVKLNKLFPRIKRNYNKLKDPQIEYQRKVIREEYIEHQSEQKRNVSIRMDK